MKNKMETTQKQVQGIEELIYSCAEEIHIKDIRCNVCHNRVEIERDIKFNQGSRLLEVKLTGASCTRCDNSGKLNEIVEIKRSHLYGHVYSLKHYDLWGDIPKEEIEYTQKIRGEMSKEDILNILNKKERELLVKIKPNYEIFKREKIPSDKLSWYGR